MNNPTPRINNSLLNKFLGHMVRILGRVEVIEDTFLQFYSPSPNNENIVKLYYSKDLNFVERRWYDCICRVSEDGIVTAIDNVDMGIDIDENAVLGLVKYTHSVSSEPFFEKELFS